MRWDHELRRQEWRKEHVICKLCLLKALSILTLNTPYAEHTERETWWHSSADTTFFCLSELPKKFLSFLQKTLTQASACSMPLERNLPTRQQRLEHERIKPRETDRKKDRSSESVFVFVFETCGDHQPLLGATHQREQACEVAHLSPLATAHLSVSSSCCFG